MRIFVILGEKVFNQVLSWCNNPSCQMLIGGQRGRGLHHLRTEVILIP
jgi:hypothetical protein